MVWPERVSLRGAPRQRSQARRGVAIRHDCARWSAIRQSNGVSRGDAQRTAGSRSRVGQRRRPQSIQGDNYFRSAERWQDTAYDPAASPEQSATRRRYRLRSRRTRLSNLGHLLLIHLLALFSTPVNFLWFDL